MEMFSKPKDKICRTCVKKIAEPLHQIFESEVIVLNESIKTCELLMAVSTLKMQSDDDLPKGICLQCLDSLTKAYNFQKMCILSDLCMRSAILPPELQLSLQKTSLSNRDDVLSNIQKDIIFVPNLINPIEYPNNFKFVYSEPLNTGIANIGQSEDASIVSESIMQQCDVVSSQDSNPMKILLMRAESDLVHNHSGTNIIIPREINGNMNMFTPVSPRTADVDHLEGTSMATPSAINTKMNIFPTTDETMLLEQRMQSVMISNEPQLGDFTNVPLSKVPPWKRTKRFQSIDGLIQEPCVQGVLVPNESNIILPTDALLPSHNDHLNDANVSEPCIQNRTNIPVVKKISKQKLSIETSDSNELNSNEADAPKENEKTIVKTDLKSSSTNLSVKGLPPEVEISLCEQTTSSKTLTTTKNDVNDDKEKPNVPENILAVSNAKECKTDQSDVVNVKNIEPTSTEVVHYHDDDGELKILIDLEDLIEKNIVDSKVITKDESISINTADESEDSSRESMEQNIIIDEEVDSEVECPDEPFKDIEKPNPWKMACFTCEICGRSYSREYRLERHLKIHKEEGQPFECDKCRKRFALKAQLDRHLITHEKIFLDMMEKKRSIKVTNVDFFPCLKCDRRFLKQESLVSHMRVHQKKIDPSKEFMCGICSKVFKSLYRLTRHTRLHQEHRRFKCDICEKTFGISSHLINHLNMHKGLKPYACDRCEKSYTQADALKKHQRTHSGEQRYLCSECGKTFSSSANYRNHQLRHAGIKQFQCPECPSKFTCKNGLFTHMPVHRQQKPYECSTCGSKFTQSYSLKKHEKIHTGERPYKCDQCDMRFKCADHLKRHKRTHTGEKPYKCEYCERKFAQSNDMIKHLQTHLGKNVHKCDECDATFRLQTELKKHISEHFQAKNQNKTKKKTEKKE